MGEGNAGLFSVLSSSCHNLGGGHIPLCSSPGGQPLLYSCRSLSPCPLRPGGGKGFLLLLVSRCSIVLSWHPKPCTTLHSPFIKLFSLQPCQCSCLFLLESARTRCTWPLGKNSLAVALKVDRQMGFIWREGVGETLG